MRFKIDWASPLEGNLPFLLFFTLYSRANSKYKPPGAYIRRGDLTEGFLPYDFGGLITVWRGLYMEGLIFGILRYLSLECPRGLLFFFLFFFYLEFFIYFFIF